MAIVHGDALVGTKIACKVDGSVYTITGYTFYTTFGNTYEAFNGDDWVVYIIEQDFDNYHWGDMAVAIYGR